MRGGAITLGGVAATLLSILGAADLLAQVEVDPFGPSCVAEDSTTSTYQARVTTNYNFDFRLKVLHNGALKHDSTTSVTNSGPSVDFSKVVDHTGWDMFTDDFLEYIGRATLTSGPDAGRWAEKNWFVTVAPPGSCMLPGRRAQPLPGLERERIDLIRGDEYA